MSFFVTVSEASLGRKAPIAEFVKRVRFKDNRASPVPDAGLHPAFQSTWNNLPAHAET